MRLSYSLLDHYQRCQLRTKVVDLERAAKDELPEGPDRDRRDAGILAHAALEMTLRAKHGLEPHLDERPLLASEEAKAMARRGVVRVVHSGILDDYEPVAIERKLVVPFWVGPFTELVAKIDFVGTHTGRKTLEIVDWKFGSGTFVQADGLFDLQTLIYLWAWQASGEKPADLTRLVRVSMEPESVPSINKDGSVSRRPVRCTWATYEAAIRSAGQDPADYQDMRAKLPSADEFLVEYPVYLSAAQIRDYFDSLVRPLAHDLGRRIVDGLPFARRYEKTTCGRCPFALECLQGLERRSTIPAFNYPTVPQAC